MDETSQEEAFALLQELCLGESPVACEALGIWQSGFGKFKFNPKWFDRSKGAENLRFACDYGRGIACNNLGVSYAEGRGVPQNQDHAVKFFRLACEVDHGRGCANLAFRYSIGVGVPKNEAMMWTLNERACGLDDATGCANLGVDFENIGKHQEALHAYQKACRFGKDRACVYYLDLLVELKNVDPTTAAGHYMDFCERGEAEGCRYRALFALRSEGDIKLGLALAGKSCSSGEIIGCQLLADIYQGQYGGTPNFVKANHFYELSCHHWKSARGLACLKWADNFEKGNGGVKDLEKAKTLRQRARDLGVCEGSCE